VIVKEAVNKSNHPVQNPLLLATEHATTLSSILHLNLAAGLLATSFPDKILYAFLSHVCYMPRPSYRPWFGHSNNIWQAVRVPFVLFVGNIHNYIIDL
jgi:hypothetical protein